jgi:sugar transferase (PEP-CTERM/EpsH1 system associated)
MHVVDNLGRGGLQNGLLNLIQRLDRGRFEHVIYSMRGLDENAARFESAHVRISCLTDRESNRSFQVPALVHAIAAERPHIVHSRNWAAIEAVAAARLAGSYGVIHSEHGLDRGIEEKEPWRRRCFRRLAFEMADRVVSVSNQLRDFHSSRTGFPAKRMLVIHNGVDSQRFCPDAAARARSRRELRVADDDFCIGAVGNLTPVKDYSTLLQAMECVGESIRNWRLVIAGEGPERERLQSFIAARPQLKNRVLFLGLSSRVSELLNAMDVYVLSSLIEGISNSVLEAMATGLPVVITATGGNPETVVDNESGLLFPVGDFGALAEKLILLDRQADLRSHLGRAALGRVRREFSMEAMLGKYERLYRSVLRTGAAPVHAVAGT